ncbi:Zinc finger BED domain-containing protein [Ooceraea biroi]|uniref:Zinc finger BED domain-containing protein n=1 Tax=Ooceraea biroi TaxID=2015173 RepID=A0A026W5K7_OOCBI|nr:Zinc finger BED domain-containing protein [Ooceraea biroi]
MDFLIVDMLPYSIVESTAFRRLNFVGPAKPSKYRMKSEKYFRTTLMPATYDKVKAKVNDMICQAQWISFTTDVWSNPTKTCSLLSFTAHFILGSQRLKMILGASVLKEDHTGSYISHKLIEVVDSYNIAQYLKKTDIFIWDEANADIVKDIYGDLIQKRSECWSRKDCVISRLLRSAQYEHLTLSASHVQSDRDLFSTKVEQSAGLVGNAYR